MATKSKRARPKRERKPFPVVGIGASAGGLDALRELFSHLDPKTGLAFIAALHLDPKHRSEIAGILGRVTEMPVAEIRDGVRIEPNHVYIAPPDKIVRVDDGVLRLDPFADHEPRIDPFLRSLASELKNRAIAVILSGAGTDGIEGMRAVKEEGGITIAQDESARFGGMPAHAIRSGQVDLILPPAAIAEELARLPHDGYLTTDEIPETAEQQLEEIFRRLERRYDVDFSRYKTASIARRVRRRMTLRRIDSVGAYLTLVREHPEELDLLYEDILIRVTSFFRDPEVYAYLQQQIFPRLLEHEKNGQVRMWVPGCATGEEAYSIAIAFSEVASRMGAPISLQVFGTDVSETSVTFARAALYPEGSVAHLSAERIRRFFIKVDGKYRVKPAIRDACIFARQNVVKDPPFSRIDLISCRNVLIYLGPSLQRRVMNIFHYALANDGYLLLGSSEAIGTHSDQFSTVDRKHKVFAKRPGAQQLPTELTAPPRREAARHEPLDEPLLPQHIFREADRVVLSRYGPPGVLVDSDLQILQFRGRTSRYLELAPGSPTTDLLKMAREGLLGELKTAITRARRSNESVRREDVRIEADGGSLLVDLEVLPVLMPDHGKTFLVLFHEKREEPAKPAAKGKRTAPGKREVDQSRRLKAELEATREYLQSIIEEQEAMNEELRAANEEIQSSNEELQSTNEELETAKEELQSSNEELTTLNDELLARNAELGQVSNDLANLLASIEIPIIILGEDFRIRRFSPAAERVVKIIPSDLGRPLSDLQFPLETRAIEKIVRDSLANLEVRELHVEGRDGRIYLLRARPYRTLENRIEGAVLVLIDVEIMRKSLEPKPSR